MKSVEVLAVTRALLVEYLAARADVLVVDVSTELAAEQVHPEHATPQTYAFTYIESLQVRNASVCTTCIRNCLTRRKECADCVSACAEKKQSHQLKTRRFFVSSHLSMSNSDVYHCTVMSP